MGILGGPGAEPARSENFKSVHRAEGAHYNIYEIDPENGVAALREMFPLGEANTMNFVLFSTSGVHGSYVTIEEIEAGLEKYGSDPEFGDEEPDDWLGNMLTVLIVQPRLVCMRYGNIAVKLADIPFLKQLRASSWAVVKLIGEPD
jgi:hypothetical protein